MTTANNYAPVVTTANGSATVFSGSWNAISAAYLVVQLLNTTTGIYTTVTQGAGSTQYQVTSLSSSGFVITFNTAPAAGNNVVISRSTTQQQTIPYTTSRGFQGSVEESSFDALTNMVQELNNMVSNSIQVSVGDTATDLILPIASIRANQTLIFDASGNATVGSVTSATVSAIMQPVVDAATLAIARTQLGLGSNFTTLSVLSSATDTDLGTAASNNVQITGTTTITSFGSTAVAQSPIYLIEFTGILQLTYNATSMILPGAANITTAAGDSCVAQYLGSGNWRVLSYSLASGKALVAQSVFTPTYLWVREEQASGTAGQSLTATTWNQRILNTTKVNTISGASLTSNQFTLPAGTYEFDITSPVTVGAGAGGKARLQNITDSTTVAYGTNTYSSISSGGTAQTNSVITGQFTITGSKTFEVDFYSIGSYSGGSVSSISGVVEVYTNVYIRKVA